MHTQYTYKYLDLIGIWLYFINEIIENHIQMLRQLRGLGILKSLSDKIELNKGNNNLTLPDIQKMTLFQKIYLNHFQVTKN